MKKIITLFFLGASAASYAQPKLLTQAIVSTKTTIVAPEGDEGGAGLQTSTANDGGEVRVMRFGGDGETKTTTWLKNDLVKTYSESEMGRTTTIRDNAKKITTTIMEMMGRKNGFYATDEEQAEMSKRMDSMMRKRDPNASSVPAMNSSPVFSVVYLDGSKKVSGYTCKKALLITKRAERADTTTVWYCPDFKLQNLPGTGGLAGGLGPLNMVSTQNGMDLLNGFPMQYERNMTRGRHMTVEVTKLVIDKDIADKEFEIPKDIEVRSAKDMQNGGPGGGPVFQMRVGG